MPKQETFLTYSIEQLQKLYHTLMETGDFQIEDKIKIVNRCIELETA